MNRRTDEQKDGLTDGRTNRRMDEQKDGRTEGRTTGLRELDFIPCVEIYQMLFQTVVSSPRETVVHWDFSVLTTTGQQAVSTSDDLYGGFD